MHSGDMQLLSAGTDFQTIRTNPRWDYLRHAPESAPKWSVSSQKALEQRKAASAQKQLEESVQNALDMLQVHNSEPSRGEEDSRKVSEKRNGWCESATGCSCLRTFGPGPDPSDSLWVDGIAVVIVIAHNEIRDVAERKKKRGETWPPSTRKCASSFGGVNSSKLVTFGCNFAAKSESARAQASPPS
ncbi:hypothetical protein FIBSPDRAFT_220557 [Athelia psychrophila]|uniref:Uncharacterized protein n=1 Tax=Athelia psychrophila TaxID=1759441 RepID=A0A165Z482_9AGAM|nr:hypothetical protein FIBSPDRAFT_220557 [Fibularhizoctonia sp. CBS 109695]